MKNDNKKLGMYVGIALLVGVVGYVAYYKMSSKNSNVSTSSDSKDESKDTFSSKWQMPNPFSSNPANYINKTFIPKL